MVHNFYGSSGPSGENNAVEAELALLRGAGHAVELFARHSDELRAAGLTGAVRGGLSVPWNPVAAAQVRRAVAQFKPDVLHVHNTFPSISPAALRGIGAHVARVCTLHNYRLFCAQGLFTRDGAICTVCLDRKSVLPGIVHACYRNSRMATLPLALGIRLHAWLRTWQREVDAYVVLTEHQRRLFERGGLPRDRLHVKPNFVAAEAAPRPWPLRARQVVYAGRIAEEKGVDVLVRAWLRWGREAPVLRIVGDGPIMESLARLVAAADAGNIQFLGARSRAETLDEIGNSSLLIVPSIGMEGLPMVIPEAFARGTPVAAADAGPLPSIIDPGTTGLVFKAGDSQALLDAVAHAWRDPERLAAMGETALQTYRARYSPEINLRRLLQIYALAIDHRRSCA